MSPSGTETRIVLYCKRRRSSTRKISGISASHYGPARRALCGYGRLPPQHGADRSRSEIGPTFPIPNQASMDLRAISANFAAFEPLASAAAMAHAVLKTELIAFNAHSAEFPGSETVAGA
jgi:hypothetical protein